MIVLDTNVVSELMRPEPEPRVVTWLDALDGRRVTVTSMTVAEVLVGLTRLPPGARRAGLTDAFLDVVADHLAPPLPFDAIAAEHVADIVASRAAAGRPIGPQDAVIAATTRAHGATLATRNTRDFAGTGLPLADPWTDDPPPPP